MKTRIEYIVYKDGETYLLFRGRNSEAKAQKAARRLQKTGFAVEVKRQTVKEAQS